MTRRGRGGTFVLLGPLRFPVPGPRPNGTASGSGQDFTGLDPIGTVLEGPKGLKLGGRIPMLVDYYGGCYPLLRVKAPIPGLREGDRH